MRSNCRSLALILMTSLALAACSPRALQRERAWIAVPTVGEGVNTVSVSTRRPGDTLVRTVGRLTIVVQPAPRGISGVLMTRDWTPPFLSSDTLVLEPKTLLPIREALHFNGAVRTYRYAGRRVTGSLAVPDSAPRSFDATYDEPVFAFNEVEPLVRSLDYRVGVRIVVPLFSEVDHAVEHDTLSVVARDAEHGTWIVEFADPVITTLYTVDAATRMLREAVTTQRQSGLAVLYHYESRGPA